MERHGADHSLDSLRIDLEAEALWRGDERIHLRTKTWQVLRYLAAHPGALVTKRQLLDAVWGEVVVSEETLTKSISELRRALGDDPQTPRVIETVHGRGFRWIPRIGGEPRPREQAAASQGTLRPPPLPSPSGRAVVGREAELAQLERLWERARGGEGQTVFLTGDPGIGKTSLLDAFFARRAADAQPPWLLSGQCLEQYGPGEPHLPLLNAFESLLRRAGSEALVSLARRTAPTWLAHVPWAAGPSAPASNSGYSTEQRMPRELAAFLESLGDSAPVILALDDLHWSDSSTLDALALLTQRPRGRWPLLVIGAYRPVEAAARDAAIRKLHRDLRLRRLCGQVSLEYLGENAVRALLADRLERVAHEASLTRLLHAHTDGHPLFIVALVDHMLERGWLTRASDGWKLVVAKDVVLEAVPSDVRQMIETVVESLIPEVLQTLRTASVAGLEFDSRAVAAALKTTADDVETLCDAVAMTHRLVRRCESSRWPDRTVGARYAFQHALFRRVLHDQLGETARRAIHQSIGERLEQGCGEDASSVCNELASHFSASGDDARACRYLELAGTRALGRFAYREALRCFEQALERAGATAEPARTELRLRRRQAIALSAVHGYTAEPVAANLARARELCAEVGDPESWLEVLYALAFLHFTRADRELAWSTVRELAELASRAGPVAHLQGLFALGTVAVWGGDQRTAAAAFGQLELQRHDAVSAEIMAGYGVAPMVSASSNLAYHLWLTGKADEARACSARTLARARALDHPFTLAGALVHAANLALMLDEPDSAARLASEAQAVAAEHGFELWRRAARIGRACATLHSAPDPGRAIARARAAAAEWESADSRIFLATAHGLLASALLRAGRPADGLAAAERGISLAATTLDCMYEAELWRLKGELLLLAGAAEASALGCFARAREIAAAQGATALEQRAATSLARLAGPRSRRDSQV